MRTESVASSLGRSHLSGKPQEGSKLRAVYDYFYLHRGKTVPRPAIGNHHQIYMLVDFYGLDIRNMGYGKWNLCGEWFGTVYVDYLADQIA